MATTLEALGFTHNFGDNGVAKAFGNAGQTSYGEGGRVYTPTERIARKTTTMVVTLGSIAGVLSQYV